MGEAIDEDVLQRDGRTLLDAGVLLVRVPGSAPGMPARFGARPGEPKAQLAGNAVAAQGRFFPGWGRHVPVERIPEAARQEAEVHGWAKLIADWFTDDGDYARSIPASVMAEAVREVHGVGGRVAVHTQHAESGRAAVAAGVDSIEHGMHLPMDVLPIMAAQDITLVPTAVTFAALGEQMSSDEVPARLRTWSSRGWARHEELVGAAHGAGVRVLAGTDLPPGALAAEVEWLHGAGMGSRAVAAASWSARERLGMPGIEEGAPADLACYSQDPRSQPAVLNSPDLIMFRGQVMRHA